MTIKTFNKDGVEIKVGDKVVVTDTGWTYTTYDKWVERNNFTGWENSSKCTVGQVGVIEVIAEHGVSDDTLYGVNINGKKVIIGYKGVEFVSRDSQPFQLEPFQRVLLRNGKVAIVTTTKKSSEFNLHFAGNMWTDASFTDKGSPEYEIVKVFAAPVDIPYKMLNHDTVGALLWEAVNPEVEAADESLINNAPQARGLS